MLAVAGSGAVSRQEDLVARAKRTQRTDARRRNRAEQAALAGETIEAGEPGTTSSGTGASATKPAQQRPGFTSLMKAAYRPPNIVDDLKSLPMVLLNPGFAIATLGSIGIAVYFVFTFNDAVSQVPIGDTAGLAAVSQSYQVAAMMMGLVVSPPPAVGAFLIGFFAKRASWLGGLIYGIVCTILVIFVLQQPAGRLFTGDAPPQDFIVTYAAWAPMGAALFAAAAAWYKRFLNMSNPNRAARQEQQKKQERKPPQGRGDVKSNYRSGSR
jgi:hypothetical protein